VWGRLTPWETRDDVDYAQDDMEEMDKVDAVGECDVFEV
jgi:hypothetical protein